MNRTTERMYLSLSPIAVLGTIAGLGILPFNLALASTNNETPATMVTVVPQRDDSMLLNPGKGWVQYYGPDKYTKDYISVGYTRVRWADVEPKENEFNWRVIDDFITEFKLLGKKAAFGVMSVSTGLGQYVTPKWVFDAGVPSVLVTGTTSPTGKQVIPKNWDDPIFLEKLNSFVKTLGKRYDGNPDIAFIDVRSYGNWGEGHIGMLDAPGIILTPPDVLKNGYFLPYVKAFPKTQLIIPWGFSGYDAVYDWAVSQGAGMRRDGILSQWSKDGSECLRAYGHSPAVFEYCDGYDDMKKNGWWKPDMLRDTYVRTGRPSYMQWNSTIFEENREFCLKLGNLIGYHFVLAKATLPTGIRPGAPCKLQFEWINDGVNYLYKPCHIGIALLDAKDAVVERQWAAQIQPKKWAPGSATSENVSVTFRHVSTGSYKLAVGLFLDRMDAHPTYRLGIRGRTEVGWYILKDQVSVR